MKYILTMLAIIILSASTLAFIIFLRGQLSDCQFECNHLQAKIWRLEELNDYVPAMEQVLNSMQLAELEALTEQIRQKKYRNYESVELPLLTEKERNLIDPSSKS